MTKFQVGCIPWSKGLSNKEVLKHYTNGFAKPWLGKKRSLEDRTKMQNARLANPNRYWLGKKRPEQSALMKTWTGTLNNHYGSHQTDEWKTKMSTLKKRMIERGEISMPHNNPSLLELKMLAIIRKSKLPYKFVGNGNVLVGTKRPDFVRTDGKKIALEVFYKEHKIFKEGNFEKWKVNRRTYFARRGWKIIFFDEKQVNSIFTLKRLKEAVSV